MVPSPVTTTTTTYHPHMLIVRCKELGSSPRSCVRCGKRYINASMLALHVPHCVPPPPPPPPPSSLSEAVVPEPDVGEPPLTTTRIWKRVCELSVQVSQLDSEVQHIKKRSRRLVTTAAAASELPSPPMVDWTYVQEQVSLSLAENDFPNLIHRSLVDLIYTLLHRALYSLLPMQRPVTVMRQQRRFVLYVYYHGGGGWTEWIPSMFLHWLIELQDSIRNDFFAWKNKQPSTRQDDATNDRILMKVCKQQFTSNSVMVKKVYTHIVKHCMRV